MNVNWHAVAYGFITALVLGIIGGFVVPFTDAILPTLSSGIVGIIGGFVAGYFAGTGVGSGALHGGLATVIGVIVSVVVLFVVGTLASGLLGLGVLAVGTVLIVAAALPGILGGAIGGWMRVRSGREVDTGRPTPP